MERIWLKSYPRGVPAATTGGTMGGARGAGQVCASDRARSAKDEERP